MQVRCKNSFETISNRSRQAFWSSETAAETRSCKTPEIVPLTPQKTHENLCNRGLTEGILFSVLR